MRQQLHIRRTTVIIIFLCALLLGLYFAKLTTPLSAYWLLLCPIFALLIPRRTIGMLAAVIVIAFLFGWWRGGALQAQLAPYNELYFQNVSLIGRATEDGIYGNKSQLEFTVEGSKLNGQTVPGKIKVSGFGAASVNRHDIISARGKLYPTRGGKQANISYAEIDVIARATGPVETFRKNFIAGMLNALPEPAASFGIGLLVGQRNLLPDDVALVLTTAGLTHIVAVSGYNLTIITRAIQRSFKRFSRFQTVFAAGLLIYLFILVTGFSPSIIRAGLVAAIGLLAWYFGRKLRPTLLIMFVAALTAFANPLYVWGDIGWYLSFLAFFGVLVLAPVALQAFAKKDIENTNFFAGIVTESFAAQIMTLPLIMLIFSRFSLVGLAANIVIVPMVPFAMLFSLIAGIAGMIAPEIAGWFALPARIWLDIMLWLADWFAHIPHANTIVSITAIGMLVLYACIVALIIGLKRRSQSVTIKEITEN